MQLVTESSVINSVSGVIATQDFNQIPLYSTITYPIQRSDHTDYFAFLRLGDAVISNPQYQNFITVDFGYGSVLVAAYPYKPLDVTTSYIAFGGGISSNVGFYLYAPQNLELDTYPCLYRIAVTESSGNVTDYDLSLWPGTNYVGLIGNIALVSVTPSVNPNGWISNFGINKISYSPVTTGNYPIPYGIYPV